MPYEGLLNPITEAQIFTSAAEEVGPVMHTGPTYAHYSTVDDGISHSSGPLCHHTVQRLVYSHMLTVGNQGWCVTDYTSACGREGLMTAARQLVSTREQPEEHYHQGAI